MKEICDQALNHNRELLAKVVLDGPEAVSVHLQTMAFSLGAQVAVCTTPHEMETLVNLIMERFGMGFKAGMEEAHGLRGQVNVSVYAFRRQ